MAYVVVCAICLNLNLKTYACFYCNVSIITSLIITWLDKHQQRSGALKSTSSSALVQY